jgi:hypothetical protein
VRLVPLRLHPGTVIHRDVVLEADARRNRMLLCVSRVEGQVVLTL